MISFRILRVVLFMFLAVLPALSAEGAATPDPSAAREIFELVNDFRQQQGLPQLQWDDRLARAALDHAYLCARNKELSHQYSGEPVLTLRLAKHDIRLNRAGENLAMDSNPRSAHESLLASPPHRANILKPDFNSLGVAAVWSSGRLYVVQNFAHILPETTVAQFEDQIAAAFAKLRSTSQMSVLPHTVSTTLRERACEMAHNDNIDALSARTPGARYILTFTISEPSQLPTDLTRMRDSREISSYAIGACFDKSQSYPNGVYWVVVAMYANRSSAGARNK